MIVFLKVPLNFRISQKLVLFLRNNSYKNTLNFPKFLLPIKIAPVSDATNISESLSLYLKSDEHLKFSLHDGPPYANGNLHVGHALNKILKDILSKYKRIKGFTVNFKPGWDCHGLPIEMKSTLTQQNSVSEIRNNASKTSIKYLNIQKAEFKSWGISSDWDNRYATSDFLYQSKEIKAFNMLYQKSLIFRDFLPTFWSCSAKTALAEAELEYNDQHCSDTLFIKFQLIPNCPLFSDHRNVSVLVWTTTPWTIVANEAVGINPKLKYLLCQSDKSNETLILGANSLEKLRQSTNNKLKIIDEFIGQDLIGCQYFHPIISQKICSIIDADFVSDDKGTALVHIAPAHGKEDFYLMQSRGVHRSEYVNSEGLYTDLCGKELSELNVLSDGSEKIMSMLNSRIFYREKLIHSYPYDWRTKTPTIIRLSTQWFIDVAKLSDKAIDAYQNVNVHPPFMKESMLQFLKNRPNWCISRQRKWGVPIPVLYKNDSKDIIADSDFIDDISDRVEREGSDFWFSETLENLVPKKYLHKWNVDYSQLEKSQDIFDIWFDSGLSWWCALSENAEIDVCLEGLDQFRGWFSSSLLTGVAMTGKCPYKTLVCHGFATDNDGKKMSKSLGNVIDPKEVVEKFGVDVLRYWACSSGLNSRSSISQSMLNQIEKKYLSLRNLFRFLLGNISNTAIRESIDELLKPSVYQSLLPQDRYILNKLGSSINKIESSYENYHFNLIVSVLEKLDNKISNFYFTIIKDRLYCDSPSSESYKSCVVTLMLILHTLIPVCIPLFPCLSLEVIYSIENSGIYKKPIFFQWPKYINIWTDENTVHSMENLILPIRNKIHDIDFSKNGIEISNKTNPMSELSFEIFVADPCQKDILQKFNNSSSDWQKFSTICEVIRCSSVKISEFLAINDSKSPSAVLIDIEKGNLSIAVMVHGKNERCVRCRRHIKKDIHKDCCERCSNIVKESSKSEQLVEINV